MRIASPRLATLRNHDDERYCERPRHSCPSAARASERGSRDKLHELLEAGADLLCPVFAALALGDEVDGLFELGAETLGEPMVVLEVLLVRLLQICYKLLRRLRALLSEHLVIQLRAFDLGRFDVFLTTFFPEIRLL